MFLNRIVFQSFEKKLNNKQKASFFKSFLIFLLTFWNVSKAEPVLSSYATPTSKPVQAIVFGQTVMLGKNSREFSNIKPGIWAQMWRKPVFCVGDGSRITMPNGKDQISVDTSVTLSPSGIHFRYVLEPLSAVEVFGCQVYLSLAGSTDWLGVHYRLDQETGFLYKNPDPKKVVAEGDISSLFLGPCISCDSLSFQLTAPHTHLAIVGQGIWVGESPSDKTWVWKPGEKKVLDFTMQFNCPVLDIQKEIASFEAHSAFPFQEQDLWAKDPMGSFKVPLHLSTPNGPGPFPTILMISLPYAKKPIESWDFHHRSWFLTNFLVRQGFAVLRFTDEPIQGTMPKDSKGMLDKVMTVMDGLEPVPNIDARKIGLLSLDEHGIVAAQVASRSKKVAFLVLLNCPGLDAESDLLLERRNHWKRRGYPEETIARLLKFQKQAIEILEQEKDNKLANAKLFQLEKTAAKGLESNDAMDLEVNFYWAGIDYNCYLATDYFRRALANDPGELFRSVKCPVLALGPEWDGDKPEKEDLNGIERALKLGGNNDFLIMEFPEVNSSFQPAESPQTLDLFIPETYSAQILKTIGDWLKKHIP